MIKNSQKKKVLVALSGGVDSSVAAALLKKDGFEVYGLFMHFWSSGDKENYSNKCCSPESEKIARATASKLGFPLLVLDLKEKFKKEVVDFFIEEYKKGRTPNPCVVCNKKIKFSFLLKEAEKIGCHFIATGHYARIRKKGNIFYLLRGKDKEKDQSYFLWRLTQKELGRVLFPCGDYLKSQVRKLAQKFFLPTFSRPESQEICFVPQKDYREFLKEAIEKEKIIPGPIFNKEGKKIGRHIGLIFYTVGQRKGLALKVTNSQFDPFYVIKIDSLKNALFVGKFEDLYQKECFLEKVSWISKRQTPLPLNCEVKIRYGAEAAPAQILKEKNLKVVFKKKVWAPTPGQSAVFYKRDELLGGGIIKNL